MELIPAIDLLDGAAVRLVQGDYRRRVQAGVDPLVLAKRFVAAGCRRLHVVDLAGARAGRPMQRALIGRIGAAARADAPEVIVEAGGGLRSAADVDAVLEVADEALLGTAAVESPGFLRAAADRHPGRILAALDLRGDVAAVDGWTRGAAGGADDVARRLVTEGAARLVVTDARRDGTLTGPNLDLMLRLRTALPNVPLVAAGGIRSLDDLRALDAIGCDGAVVGMALLGGALDPESAMAALR